MSILLCCYPRKIYRTGVLLTTKYEVVPSQHSIALWFRAEHAKEPHPHEQESRLEPVDGLGFVTHSPQRNLSIEVLHQT